MSRHSSRRSHASKYTSRHVLRRKVYVRDKEPMIAFPSLGPPPSVAQLPPSLLCVTCSQFILRMSRHPFQQSHAHVRRHAQHTPLMKTTRETGTGDISQRTSYHRKLEKHQKGFVRSDQPQTWTNLTDITGQAVTTESVSAPSDRSKPSLSSHESIHRSPLSP